MTIAQTTTLDWNSPEIRSKLVFPEQIDALIAAHPEHRIYLEGARIHMENAKQSAETLFKSYSTSDALQWRRSVIENPPSADVIGYLLAFYSSYKQSEKARLPRPKKKPTHKSIVIDTMLYWIKTYDKVTTDQFIEAGLNNGLGEIRLQLINTGKLERYIISCDGLETTKNISRSTINGYLNDARKQLIS